MARMLDTKAYLDEICALLEQGATCVGVPVAGGSMCPFLHNGDMVYLAPLPERLKRGDIVLYTRRGGQYVLHRIYRAERDGSYLMVGDAQQYLERIESRDSLHGIVTAACHKGKPTRPGQLRWWFYSFVWIRLVPARRKLLRLWAVLRGKK